MNILNERHIDNQQAEMRKAYWYEMCQQLKAERDAARAQVAQLRTALEQIATGYEWSGDNCRETARAALAQTQQGDEKAA